MNKDVFIDEATSILKMLSRSLVDDQSLVRVDVVSGQSTTVFHIECGYSDRGKLIGKRGRNASAMRTILNSIAAKYKHRAVLDIAEDSEAC